MEILDLKNNFTYLKYQTPNNLSYPKFHTPNSTWGIPVPKVKDPPPSIEEVMPTFTFN